MTDKFLRGREPLTFYRGASGGQAGNLYRGDIIAAERIDADDAERLVREGFIERVVRDGEQFRLAEDTPTGQKGDPVVLGDESHPPADEQDNGTVNLGLKNASDDSLQSDEAKEREEVAARRAAARAKLPADQSAPDGRASKDVWVEYQVGRGYDFDTLVKSDKAELQKLA